MDFIILLLVQVLPNGKMLWLKLVIWFNLVKIRNVRRIGMSLTILPSQDVLSVEQNIKGNCLFSISIMHLLTESICLRITD